jgi:hypothetical protein
MFKLSDEPFATTDLVVVFGMFLDFDIGEVAFQVHDILSVIGLMREPGKPLAIQPHCQLTVIGAKDVDSQVELFTPEKQRL